MKPNRPLLIAVALTLVTPLLRAEPAIYDEDPIHYSASKPNDPAAQLQQWITQGKVKLKSDGERGYLQSVLAALKIPASSQTLVFSKTSFQRDIISPKNPRALYFDDDTYIGYVPGGDVVEIASTDPQLGTVFYTLDQNTRRPKLVRQTDNCLQCHGSTLTRDIPGLVVRSVFSDSRGLPIFTAGTFVTTHESPLAERWGGWYVTGHLGNQHHMGNQIWKETDGPDPAPTTHVDNLSSYLDVSKYLTPESDVVALMVLEHQVEAHNRLTRANYRARTALRDEKALNDALHEPTVPGVHTESIQSRLKNAGEPLVEYLLFSGEAPLAEPVSGTTSFARDFAARGPRDKNGRSLRDFDLKTRLFKYPCSYLIYSSSFDALPEAEKDYIYRRLYEILTGKDTSKDFAHLTPQDRTNILEILRDTKKGLPDYWTSGK